MQALCAADLPDQALTVCAELWTRGFVVGLTEAAWIAREQGDFSDAIKSMQSAVTHLDGGERLAAIGIVGCWRWHYLNDVSAEPLLREGMRHYGAAWADLGNLLRSTERDDEGLRVLKEGAANGVLECILPLANILSRSGSRDQAKALYAQAFELGDGHAAWNLAVDLAEDGRMTEASEWRWRAAMAGDELAITHLADSDWPDE